MTAPLSRMQHKVLDYITSFTALNGFAPSLKEIAAALGLSAKGSVCRHIHNLAKAGAITYSPHRHRSIQVTASTLLNVALPADVDRELRRVAASLGLSRESVAIEALRDGLSTGRSLFVERETSPSLRGGDNGPGTRRLRVGAPGPLREAG